MSAHSWSLVAIASITEVQAAELARMGLPQRQARLPELMATAETVRVPLCTECRVTYEDFAAMTATGQDWPCAPRPKALGGTLSTDVPHKSRQERRDAAAKARKRAATEERRAARPKPRGSRRPRDRDAETKAAVTDAVFRAGHVKNADSVDA